jgi:hypothetical protein
MRVITELGNRVENGSESALRITTYSDELNAISRLGT